MESYGENGMALLAEGDTGSSSYLTFTEGRGLSGSDLLGFLEGIDRSIKHVKTHLQMSRYGRMYDNNIMHNYL